MSYPDRSILMAPTSILAVQLYHEAIKFLPKHIKVSLVKQGSGDEALDADFLIGTHALLYKDNLPEAPLIMIDEQHRFGTKQRTMLEKLVSFLGERRTKFLNRFQATQFQETKGLWMVGG